jgi:hypothetical protein
MTGLARRLAASVFTLLWSLSPWGRASLRLREAYHFDTQFNPLNPTATCIFDMSVAIKTLLG